MENEVARSIFGTYTSLSQRNELGTPNIYLQVQEYPSRILSSDLCLATKSLCIRKKGPSLFLIAIAAPLDACGGRKW